MLCRRLRSGRSPVGGRRRRTYAKAVDRAIHFLLDKAQAADGSFAPPRPARV